MCAPKWGNISPKNSQILPKILFLLVETNICDELTYIIEKPQSLTICVTNIQEINISIKIYIFILYQPFLDFLYPGVIRDAKISKCLLRAYGWLAQSTHLPKNT